MSFFDLENELPGWLDEVLSSSFPNFIEIVNHRDIKDMDATSPKAYHMVCAGKGNIVIAGRQGHHIWKYEAPKGYMRTYGKYLEYNNNNRILRFWVGLVVQDKIINFYLWFGEIKDLNILQRLQPLLVKGKYEYWNKEQQGINKQASDKLRECCGCGSLPLSVDELGGLKREVTQAISDLLEAVEQAVKNI